MVSISWWNSLSKPEQTLSLANPINARKVRSLRPPTPGLFLVTFRERGDSPGQGWPIGRYRDKHLHIQLFSLRLYLTVPVFWEIKLVFVGFVSVTKDRGVGLDMRTTLRDLSNSACRAIMVLSYITTYEVRLTSNRKLWQGIVSLCI